VSFKCRSYKPAPAYAVRRFLAQGHGAVNAAPAVAGTGARHGEVTETLYTDSPKRSDRMTISIPLWVIVGVVVYIAWRYMGLRIWQLLACVAFGVLLAATSAGPEINHFLSGLVHWLTKP